MSVNDEPFEMMVRQIRERREEYETDVLNSRPFQDGLHYLENITSDFLLAFTCVRLHGVRYSAEEDYLLFRFAPHIVESTLAITANAKEGLQNSARRELRFLLEAAVKLSSRDFYTGAKTFDERLAGLDDRDQRFENYVSSQFYFGEFDRPDETKVAMLSLYSELSRFVHATTLQFNVAVARAMRNEEAGMESVATLNQFNRMAFQVYDLVLVRVFHGIGLSMAGDIFTEILDGKPKWRFHKGKHVAKLSKCFDYKHERNCEMPP